MPSVKTYCSCSEAQIRAVEPQMRFVFSSLGSTIVTYFALYVVTVSVRVYMCVRTHACGGI